MHNRHSRRFAACCAFFLATQLNIAFVAGDEPAAYFESHVRPLLVEHCQGCHNAEDQQGGVRLDIRSGVFGKIGKAPVVAAKDPGRSRLLAVVKYDDNDIQMPPDGALSKEQQGVLEHWIETGAYWPEETESVELRDPFPRRDDGSIDFSAAVQSHWSYQPIIAANPPVIDGAPPTSVVDAFVIDRLAEEGLSLSPSADRATLHRRMSFDLLGLPPAYEDVVSFSNDEAPDAIERLVDRLLANPHFGERWARHWLDVARYADTSGYRAGGRSTEYPNAYTYRDWVVAAMNRDLPFDDFVTAQLAADVTATDDPHQQAALGFLTVGPLFTDSSEEQINDQIDVVSRGLMGMTVTCARCHDHKFDPIPTSDYYSLFGVFASTKRVDNGREIPVSLVTDGIKEFRVELAKKEAEYQQTLQNVRQKIQDDNRNRLADYLVAAAVDADVLPADRRPKLEPELRARSVRGWRDLLRGQKKHRVVGVLWELAGRREAADFPKAVLEFAKPLVQAPKPKVFSPEYIELLVAEPPASFEAALRQLAGQMTAGKQPFVELFDIRPAPTSYPAESISSITDRDLGNEIRAAKTKVDEVWVKHPHAPPRAMTVVDNNPHDVQIFIRGNSGRRGEIAPRRFPQVLYAASVDRFQSGSGRRELAEAIVHPENPLTARVIVNRIWMHYFGRGLVTTPSDFGTQGERPSHPELLDSLAAGLIQNGWSLKWLHREILLSATYQQSSLDRPVARAVDPENALLWRQNRRRLEFEPMRDAMLKSAGLLNETIGGKAVPLDNIDRRSIYMKVDRNNPPELTRTFDVPDTEQSSPARSETTVPQQALFYMNSTTVRKISEALARRLGDGTDAEKAIRLSRLTLSRDPSGEERELIAGLIAEDAVAACQVMLMSNEFVFID